MKQVVVKGKENYSNLLTPYWTQEYLKRNGKDVYIYLQKFNDNISDTSSTYILVNDKSQINDFKKVYSVYFFSKNWGNILTNEEFDKITDEDFEKYYIDITQIFKDRENKHLIDIVKEINNERFLRIIEIPDDVKYFICEDECFFGEWIEEDVPIRKWF